MSSVTEHLLLLQKLTQTNLDILKTINDAFYTKQDHIYANIDETKYVVPSFLALENKLNILSENFNNLVNSPASGEAYFNIDGNTRAIEVKSYSHTPNSLTLNEVNNFIVDDTNINILKELLSPAPKVRINIPGIPNDINTVNIKKIMVKSDKLAEAIKPLIVKKNDSGMVEDASSVPYLYSDMHKMLSIYKSGEDYMEYDHMQHLPIRKNVGSAVYVIDEVISDIIDENLDNYITVKIKPNLSDPLYSNNLTYKLFDETIERKLSVGDYLINYNGTAKLQIAELKQNTNVLTLKVVNGEYLNIIPLSSYDYNKGISDQSKLRFFSPIDFNEDKYVDVTLDDTQYVFIAIAPVNSRMNVQSSWGSGILVNSHKLTSGGIAFKEYYDNNVKNIGNIIAQLTGNNEFNQ